MTSAPLSAAAIALLAELRKTYQAHPRTDAELATATGIPKRDIIDVAGELLMAGYLVLADGRGRWLGTVDEARAYVTSLGFRVRHVADRIALVERAIERQTNADRTLFDLQSVAPVSNRSPLAPSVPSCLRASVPSPHQTEPL